MKTFATVFVLSAFAAIWVATVLACQWLAVNGPEWLLDAADTRLRHNDLLALIGLVLTVIEVLAMGFVVSAVWDEKK
jgi:hypothetical protein